MKQLIVQLKIHNKITIPFFISASLYLSYLIHLFSSYKDLPNLLQFSSYYVQGTMIFFSILGFSTAKFIKSVMQYGESKRRINIISLIFLTILTLAIVLITTLIIYLFFYQPGSGSFILKQTMLFSLNHWYIPFLIICIFSYCIGQFETRFSIVFLVILWLVFSPLNHGVFSLLFNEIRFFQGVEILNNLNLSINNINEPYNELYGFHFTWDKKIYFLIGLLIVSLIIPLYKNTMLRVLSSLFLLGLVVLYASIPTQGDNAIDKVQHEFLFYDENKVEVQDESFTYKIANLEATVENYKDLNINASLRLQNLDQPEFALSLYHGFKVSSVLVDGKQVEFIRDGDVILLKNDEVNEELEVSISYKGNDLVKLNDNKLYLPATENWLPTNQKQTYFIFSGEILPESKRINAETNFTLTLKGVNPDYISLTQVKEDVYQGSGNGVTLIDNNMTQDKIGGFTIQYPTMWYLQKEQINDALNLMKQYTDKYNQLFNRENELPEEILFVPQVQLNQQFSFQSGFGKKEHALLQINPKAFTQGYEVQEIIPFQISKIFEPNLDDSLDEEFILLYHVYTGQKLINEGTDSVLFDIYLESLTANSSESEAEVIKKLGDPHDLSESFYRDWKRILENPGKDEWNDLKGLIEEEIS